MKPTNAVIDVTLESRSVAHFNPQELKRVWGF